MPMLTPDDVKIAQATGSLWGVEINGEHAGALRPWPPDQGRYPPFKVVRLRFTGPAGEALGDLVEQPDGRKWSAYRPGSSQALAWGVTREAAVWWLHTAARELGAEVTAGVDGEHLSDDGGTIYERPAWHELYGMDAEAWLLLMHDHGYDVLRCTVCGRLSLVDSPYLRPVAREDSSAGARSCPHVIREDA